MRHHFRICQHWTGSPSAHSSFVSFATSCLIPSQTAWRVNPCVFFCQWCRRIRKKQRPFYCDGCMEEKEGRWMLKHQKPPFGSLFLSSDGLQSRFPDFDLSPTCWISKTYFKKCILHILIHFRKYTFFQAKSCCFETSPFLGRDVSHQDFSGRWWGNSESLIWSLEKPLGMWGNKRWNKSMQSLSVNW